MAPKRAQFLTYGDDERCHDARKFIEDAGVMLDVRDIAENPLSVYELDGLLGYWDISHFLNRMSEAYSKYGLDKKLPGRDELLDLIAKDHTLLRRPIVRSGRLMTVGYDRRKISEMFRINQNGDRNVDVPRRRNRNARVEQFSTAK
ncbi:MAG TPA: ArsC/Spx/MgsR family protein [Acidobacteriota bacterium]|nr:ArsC/Spx/MgsR family protein [Acidobacteriota bacterium]